MAIVEFVPPAELRLASRPGYRLIFHGGGDSVQAYADDQAALAHSSPVVLDRLGQFPPVFIDDELATHVTVQNEFGVLLGEFEL